MQLRTSIIILIILISNRVSFSQIQIEQAQFAQPITEFTYFITDKKLSINSMVEYANNGAFKKNNNENLLANNGYLYLQLIMKNRTEYENFSVSLSYMEDVVIYSLLDGKYVEKNIGQMIPVSERDNKIGFRNYGKIKIDNNVTDTLFVRIDLGKNSINTSLFSIDISEQNTFEETQTFRLIVHGFLIGSLFIMSIFHFLVYIVLKEKSFLLYAISALLMGLLWSSNACTGYLLQFVYPESPELIKYDIIFLTPIYNFVFVSFFQVYLNIKNFSRVLSQFLWAMVWVSVIWMFVRLTTDIYFETAEFVMYLHAILLYNTFIFIIIYYLWKRIPISRFFIYGNIVLYVFTMYYMLGYAGIISFTSVTEYSMEVGNVIEMLFFSMALGGRIKVLQKFQDEKNQEEGSLYIKTLGVKLKYKDIVLLESSDKYVHIYISGRENPLMERVKMTEITKELPPSIFIKTHRSYYININHISSRASKYIIKMSNGMDLKISKSCVGFLDDKVLN